jgi:hypothetical protein
MHDHAERQRLAHMIHDFGMRALADPAVRLQLAGRHGQERLDRAARIIHDRIQANPMAWSLMKAAAEQMTKAEIEEMTVELFEEEVAAGRMRRATNSAGRTVYVPEGSPWRPRTRCLGTW